jgi:signal peptidase I
MKSREDSLVMVEETKKAKSPAREYAEAIGTALLLALFIQVFILQAFKIPSGSMIPTLLIGDHILVNKLSYGIRIPERISLFLFELRVPPALVPMAGHYLVEWNEPKRGDVVVFVFPEDQSKDFIKRVIGVGGDTVEVREKKVYINNQPIEDSHAYFEGDNLLAGGFPLRSDYGPRTVPEGHIFVMGDNRDRSYDSRSWGFVNLQAVKGRALVIYWSWDGTDRWLRWERIARLIN